MIWQILGVLFLVVANGFFVAAEFALVKVRLTEFEPGVGGRAGGLARHMLGHLDAYLSACQLGITLASLGLGWAGEPLVARMLGPGLAVLGLPEDKVHYVAFPVAFLLITFLHLTVGEQAPKIAAIQRARATTLLVVYPLAVFYAVFKPFIWLINVSSNGMLRFVGLTAVSEHDQIITEDEVRMILTQSAAMGHLGKRQRRIMENVLDLGDKIARSYMVPRNQIVFLDRNQTVADALETAARSGHSRFPLCDDGLEHVLGIVHVKDLFVATHSSAELESFDSVVREASFLPETLRLEELFRQFQKTKNHMAILVDEYGVVSGMITLENVIEEMLGPIEDEFDADLPLIASKGDARYEVDAACPVEDCVQTCGLTIPEATNADTIGGVMIALLGRIPRVGETADLGGHRLTVLAAEPTRVTRVLIEARAAQDEPVEG